MIWIEAVANHIADNSYGTMGSTLFVGQLPDISGISVLLTEYDGKVYETHRNPKSIDIPSLQVRVRGNLDEYVNALSRCADIRDLLIQVTNQTIHGVSFLRIKPNGTINSLGLDENHRYVFTANFEVTLG